MNMKMTNTFGVQFIITLPKHSKNGLADIYARITVNGRRSEISLKAKILAKDWSELKGKAKGKREDVVKLNKHIDRVRSLLTDYYYQLVEMKQPVTANAVKHMYTGKEEKKVMTLLELSDYHKQMETGKLAVGTLKNYTTTTSYIKLFIKTQYDSSDLPINEVNYKFILDFETFLNNYTPTDRKKVLNNNGVMKHLERLKKLINLAIKLGLLEKDPFDKYRLHFEKVERGHLSKAELMVLAGKSFSIERLQSVLYMFLFSCYTGLSFIDIYNLSLEHVSRGIDGKEWLMIKRKKTNVMAKVPLLPQAFTLISKYRNHPVAKANGTLFPVISNQE